MRAKVPFKKTKKRVGCGAGSGHGKTSTRGHKGQRSRSGYSSRAGFEGGQNPLYRRLPKRGFSRVRFAENRAVINVDFLGKLGISEISPEILAEKGVVKKVPEGGLKILGNGEISKAVTVQAHYFSDSAKAKIEKAGGKAVVIEKYKAEKE